MKEFFFFCILILENQQENKLNKFLIKKKMEHKIDKESGEKVEMEKQIQRLIYGNYRNDVEENFIFQGITWKETSNSS